MIEPIPLARALRDLAYDVPEVRGFVGPQSGGQATDWGPFDEAVVFAVVSSSDPGPKSVTLQLWGDVLRARGDTALAFLIYVRALYCGMTALCDVLPPAGRVDRNGEPSTRYVEFLIPDVPLEIVLDLGRQLGLTPETVEARLMEVDDAAWREQFSAVEAAKIFGKRVKARWERLHSSNARY